MTFTKSTLKFSWSDPIFFFWNSAKLIHFYCIQVCVGASVNADIPCCNRRLNCSERNASNFHKFSCNRHSIFQPRNIESHWTVWITELKKNIMCKISWLWLEWMNEFISYTCSRPVRSEIANLQLAASHVITYGNLNPDGGKMYILSQLWKWHENSVTKWNSYERFRETSAVSCLIRYATN
jgi:hypothetical protein